ncbi:MAG: FG-GAP repeat protein [bacterium]
MKTLGQFLTTAVFAFIALSYGFIYVTDAESSVLPGTSQLILQGVVAASETPTATPTNTPTATPTPTNTRTPTATFTDTPTPEPTTIPFLVIWNFDTPGNFEGWTTQNIMGATVAGGVLSGQAGNNDPYVQFTTSAGVEARYVSGIAFRLRAGQETQCQAYVGIQNGDQKHLGDFTLSSPGEFETVLAPLSGDILPSDPIVLIRVDPATSAGVNFEIDWIGLISSEMTFPTPEPTPTQTATPTPSNTPINIPSFTPIPTPTQTPKPVPPDQILVSQGYGGNTTSKRLWLTPQGWRQVPFSPFQALPKLYAENVVQTSRDRSVNAAVADINGDGVPDIVCGLGPGGMGSIQPSILSVWEVHSDRRPSRMTSKGVFSLNATNPKLQNPHGALNVAAGDFVGDDLPMIAAAQGLGGSHQIRMLQYTPIGNRGILEDVGTIRGLQEEALWGNSSGGISVAAGDVDGDGLDELIVGQMNGNDAKTYIQVLNLKRDEGNVNHPVVIDSYTPPIEAMPSNKQGLGGVNLAVGDVNGDGRNDIVTATAGDIGTSGKNFVRAFKVEVGPDGSITALVSITHAVQVLGAAQNPSGGIDIASGNLDDDRADEILVGTQAVIHLDLETGNVTFDHEAPRPLMKGLNLDFAPDGTFLGASTVSTVPGNQPFDGDAAPASAAINVEIYPTAGI